MNCILNKLFFQKSIPNPGIKQKRKFQTINGYAMGTSYTLVYPNQFSLIQSFLQKKIQNKLNKIEQRFSLFRKDSEISKMNNSNSACIQVSKEMLLLLNHISKMVAYTQGAFLPIVLSSDLKVTDKSHLSAIKEYKESLCKLPLQSNFFMKPNNVQFDFNGIAKGYAVDRIAKWLLSLNINEFSFELGGEIFTTNFNTPIILESTNNQLIQIIPDTNCIATSGKLHSSKIIAGKNKNHIHNGQTGYPSQKKIFSVTIIGKYCVEAEALAKIPFTFPLKKSLEMIAGNGYKAIIVKDDGFIIKSKELKICQITK